MSSPLNISYPAFGSSIFEMAYANDTAKGYRYGFNGMERDNETTLDGGSYDFGARIYDSRIGRWLSVDPLRSKFPDQGTYNFSFNSPLFFIDQDGRDPVPHHITRAISFAQDIYKYTGNIPFIQVSKDNEVKILLFKKRDWSYITGSLQNGDIAIHIVREYSFEGAINFERNSRDRVADKFLAINYKIFGRIAGLDDWVNSWKGSAKFKYGIVIKGGPGTNNDQSKLSGDGKSVEVEWKDGLPEAFSGALDGLGGLDKKVPKTKESAREGLKDLNVDNVIDKQEEEAKEYENNKQDTSRVKQDYVPKPGGKPDDLWLRDSLKNRKGYRYYKVQEPSNLYTPIH